MTERRYSAKDELRVRRDRVNEITIQAANDAIRKMTHRGPTPEERSWNARVRPYIEKAEALRQQIAHDEMADLDAAWGGELSGDKFGWPSGRDR